MPALSPVVAHHRARIAALSRDRNQDDPEIIGARRALAAALLEEQVQRVIGGWPPLSEAQINKIAAILRGGRGGGGSA